VSPAASLAIKLRLDYDRGAMSRDPVDTQAGAIPSPGDTGPRARRSGTLRRAGKPPTSADVAREANVSRATVSYAMNARTRDRVAAPTRARVLAAARRLGYVSDQSAQALRRGRTDFVLLALPYQPLTAPAVAAALGGVARRLDELGYVPLVHPRGLIKSADLHNSWARIRPVAMVADGSLLSREFARVLRANGTTLLAVGDRNLAYAPTLIHSQAAIGRLAVEHLVERGRRELVALALDSPESAAIRATRLGAASETAERLGANMRIVSVAAEATAVAAAIHRALEDNPSLDGIYAFSDEIAIFAMEALAERGVPVPERVSVIGCDNVWASSHVRPRLTTIAFDPSAMFEHVADLVDEMVRHGSQAGASAITAAPSRVIVRESS